MAWRKYFRRHETRRLSDDFRYPALIRPGDSLFGIGSNRPTVMEIMRKAKAKSNAWNDEPNEATRDLDCNGSQGYIEGSIERKMKAVSKQVAEDDQHLKEMEKRVQEDERKI